MFYSVQTSNVYAKDSTKILIFGDSIVAGYGLPQGQDFPTVLEKLLIEKKHNVKVVNAGISGDTTTGGRNRLDWTLEQNKPDVVIVALGGNDMLRGLDPKVTKENVEDILKKLKEAKIKTVLSGVNAPLNFGFAYSNEFNKIYPDLADKYDVPIYPFLLKDIYGNAKYMQADGIHPNAAGAIDIASKLADYIEDDILD